MKNKISKILGIALVLVILAGLLISAMPVSAAVLDMTWSAQGGPSVKPSFDLVENANSTGKWLYDVSADGKTIFAINYDAATANLLYKSTDGGLTFNTAALGANLPASVPVAIAVSSDYANDATVAVAYAASLYRSVNGGATFTNYVNLASLPAPSNGGTTINAIAVGASYNGGQAILVGTDAGAARFTNNAGWENLGFTGNVLDIVFSPNHGKGDAEVLAVTTAVVGVNSVYYLETKSGTNAVNVDIGRSTVYTAAGVSTINRGSMAFAADYDMYANNQVFVGLGVAGPALVQITEVPGCDVYRVRGTLGGTSMPTRLWAAGNPYDFNVYSVAFKGNLADGWLYVGEQNPGPGPKVWRATAAGASTLSFIPNAKSATGTYNTDLWCMRDAKDTNIFAMTSGAGSSLSLSTDNSSTFNQIALINISTSDKVQFIDIQVIDASNLFLIMCDTNPVGGGIYTRLFKTVDGGANWMSVLSTTQAAFVADPNDFLSQIYPSPAYATDKTLYVTAASYKIYKSSNQGLTFTIYSSPNSVNISAFAPVDANNFFLGSTQGIYKAGSYTATPIDGRTPHTISYVSATDMFVGTTDGSIYRSTNGGANFMLVGAPGSVGANVHVLADVGYATNKMVYAASTTGINRWTIDTSASWSPALKAGNVVSISQTSDGTIYATDNTVNANQVNPAQILRCATPTSLGPTTWDTMIPYTNATAITGLSGYASVATAPVAPATSTVINGKVTAVSTGTPQVPNNTVYNLASVTGGTTPAGPYIYAVKDTVVAAPAVVSPAADAQIASNAVFTWGAVATAYAPISYDFQIGYDATFGATVVNNTLTGAGAVSGTLYAPAAGVLQPGMTYYWRVRVGATKIMASKWSATTKFAVLLSNNNYELSGIGGLSLQPSAGDTNVPLKPVFQWANVTGALSYDLQLADNPVFVNPLDAQTGLNTNVWTYTKTLDNAKTYYWRVRAVSASNVASAWVASAFTTEAKATAPGTGPTVAAPTVTVNVPAQPAPPVTVNVPTQAAPVITVTVPPAATTSAATPASIWVLIAIGAVLIIAVIVLIARTRRV